MGHSVQVISMLVGAGVVGDNYFGASFFAVPLGGRIHEGGCHAGPGHDQPISTRLPRRSAHRLGNMIAGCDDGAGVGLCPQVASRVVLADGAPISGKSDRRLWVHGSCEADLWWDTSAHVVGFPVLGALAPSDIDVRAIRGSMQQASILQTFSLMKIGETRRLSTRPR